MKRGVLKFYLHYDFETGAWTRRKNGTRETDFYLGCFDRIEDAAEARWHAAQILHGEFARRA